MLPSDNRDVGKKAPSFDMVESFWEAYLGKKEKKKVLFRLFSASSYKQAYITLHLFVEQSVFFFLVGPVRWSLRSFHCFTSLNEIISIGFPLLP